MSMQGSTLRRKKSAMWRSTVGMLLLLACSLGRTVRC